jgi:acyl-CoA reductase-like NAD-dependent aldehyde dehydrogenase
MSTETELRSGKFSRKRRRPKSAMRRRRIGADQVREGMMLDHPDAGSKIGSTGGLAAQRTAAAQTEARRVSGKIVADGQLRRALTNKTIEIENPAKAETIAVVPQCGREDVDAVVRSAHSAWRDWSKRPARDRGALLAKAADRLAEEAESLACLSALETGNALPSQTRGEAATMVDILRFFAGLAGELKGQTVPSSPGVFQYSRRESMGVVGAIIPWNAPLMQTASKIGPALTAGNTVVLKPAEQAPLAVLRVFEILQEVLPPGVANCVTGTGEETGKLLVEHPLVRKVTFTGSTSTGAEILRSAGSKIMPVTAELGGKNPIIVMPDADVRRAADGILRGLRLQRQGQSCSAGTRIYIHDDIYHQVIQRVIDLIPTFRIGDPLDDATQVGSIISKEQLARVERYVALARSTTGGKVLTGGARPSVPGFESGYFYSTTLIEGLPTESDVCRDEIFGPVATVSRWNDFDEVLGEANNTNYGLAAVIWTQNLARALEFVDRIEAGFVQVNQFSVAEANIEYGGAKMSGMGRELSLESMIQHFTWSKTVLINANGAEA